MSVFIYLLSQNMYEKVFPQKSKIIFFELELKFC